MQLLVGCPSTQIDPLIIQSALDIVMRGGAEPLAHELFREGWHLMGTHSRSALLIGLSAAEVGVKRFIGKLVPRAEWLAMNVPTPPLVDMLEEYIPKLPITCYIKDTKPHIPDSIVAEIKKGVGLRNKTTHTGADIKADTLRKILMKVQQLLYLLDLFSGERWAPEHLTSETIEDLKKGPKTKKHK